MAAALPAAVVTSLLFTSIEMPYTAKVLYYGLMTILFWWCFAIFFVPYMTWGSELTEDYHERTVLRSYAYVFNQIGKGLGTVMPTILVAVLMGIGFSLSASWSAVGITVGAASGVALLICSLTIKESDVPGFVKDPNKQGPDLCQHQKDVRFLRDYHQAAPHQISHRRQSDLSDRQYRISFGHGLLLYI